MTNIATDRMDIYYQKVDKLLVWGTSGDVVICKERHVRSRSSYSVRGVKNMCIVYSRSSYL